MLDGFQVGDDVTDIVGVKGQFRHIGMPGHDALGESLLKRFNRIALPKRAEGRRLLVRALAGRAYGMARATILLQQLLPVPEVVRRRGAYGPGGAKEKGERGSRSHAAGHSPFSRAACLATSCRNVLQTVTTSSIRRAKCSCVAK